MEKLLTSVMGKFLIVYFSCIVLIVYGMRWLDANKGYLWAGLLVIFTGLVLSLLVIFTWRIYKRGREW